VAAAGRASAWRPSQAGRARLQGGRRAWAAGDAAIGRRPFIY